MRHIATDVADALTDSDSTYCDVCNCMMYIVWQRIIIIIQNNVQTGPISNRFCDMDLFFPQSGNVIIARK